LAGQYKHFLQFLVSRTQPGGNYR